jgi:3-deoxy-D-manno-octulosonic-acid transferase
VHLFIYNIFLLFYTLGIRIASIWNPKAQKWREGRKDLVERVSAAVSTSQSPLIWMHCSSLGEFEQGRPVLEKLKSLYPGYRILLTFFSPSGYEVRKNYSGADYVFYLPFDSKKNARQFLDITRPSLVLWVKYDYWYYFLSEIKKRKITLLLVSGVFRPGQAFFKWYGRLHRFMLDCFTRLFVQTDTSVELLKSIGLNKQVVLTGDTRFDRVADIALAFTPVEHIESFIGSRRAVVAGSTWIEDEEELDHFANTHPNLAFIIAPHEIHEERLRDAEKLFKHSVRYSTLLSTGKIPDHCNVLLIDNIGLLSRLYYYAYITYVGGGFGSDGVHNVLEAAVYGKPVMFGPEYDKYIEAIELVEAGGGISIENALELEQEISRLMSDTLEYEQACRAAKQYVIGKKGATEKITLYIQENLLLTN